MSKTGRSRVYDESCDGYAKGEGALSVLMELHDSEKRQEHLEKGPLTGAESEIVMVDGCFMVEGPCANHAEKAVNHVLWLTGLWADG